MPRRPSKVNDQKIKSAEKRTEIMNLRRAGLTYVQIGQKLGFDESYARKVIREEFALLAEAKKDVAEDLLTAELDRLDQIMAGFYEKATSGDAKAAEIVLRIMERRSRLVGLDAPTKTQSTINVNQKTDAELLEEARALGISIPVELEGMSNGPPSTPGYPGPDLGP